MEIGLKLSVKNLIHRKWDSLLSLLLMVVGVSIVSLVWQISRSLEDTLSKNLGNSDLVVGAKGSPFQLILSSVFQMDYPTGNIPYEAYEEIRKNGLVKSTVPLSYGDSYEGYRIVGTTPAYLDLFELTLLEGQMWERPLEAVIGYKVANEKSLSLGDQFYSAHGLDRDGEVHDDHPFTVVGILKPSGKVSDRLVLCDYHSIWEMHDHSHEGEDHPEEGEDHAYMQEEDGHPEHEEKEKGHAEAHEDHDHSDDAITALLLSYRNPMAAVQLPRQINENSNLQAASPVFELNRLMDLMGIGFEVLQWLAFLIMGIAGLSIFLAMLKSMRERIYDMALLKSFGVSNGFIFRWMLTEGVLIAFFGALLGLLINKVLFVVLQGQWGDLAIPSVAWFTWQDGVILMAALVLGMISALVPASQLSRTEVADVLLKN